MQIPADKRFWGEIAIAAFLSLVLLHIGPLFFLFLAPIHFVLVRRGIQGGGWVVALVLTATGIIRALQTGTYPPEADRGALIVLDLMIPVLMALSVLIVHVRWQALEEKPLGRVLRIDRKLHRLLITVAGIGLISIPLWLVASGNVFLQQAVNAQVTAAFEVMGTEPVGGTVEFVKNMVLSTFLFLFFVMFVLNWLIGSAIARRSLGNQNRLIRLTDFFLDDRMIWPFIFAWTGIFFTVTMQLQSLRFAFINAGIIFLFLYGVQGLGILIWFLRRSKLSPQSRMLVTVLLIVSLFAIPGLNLVLSIGLPALGISDIWFKYRTRNR
ncbi:MAG: YybS family protein [Spirochaetales bacterium]|nr:YybS family protein [Spirochaetales bacterium]MCF7937486.1 YybS family protein [Spirochaetales bacterium]